MKNNSNATNLGKKVKATLKNTHMIKKAVVEGKTVQEALQIPDEMMQKFYLAARNLFEKEHYTDAANGFLFLTLLNAEQHDYWLGLGMATQLTGDFESAVNAYEMAAIFEVENPVPYFYLAKCLFAMHERQSSLLALDIAIQYAADIAEYQELKKQAIEAKALLEKHLF